MNSHCIRELLLQPKVTSIAETECLDDGRQLQTVEVADKTGKAKFDLWQNHVGTLKLAKAYHITNAMVKVYQDDYSLTTPKDGTLIITEAENIPQVSVELLLTHKRICRMPR